MVGIGFIGIQDIIVATLGDQVIDCLVSVGIYFRCAFMQQYGIFIAVIGKNAVFFFIAVKVGKPLGVEREISVGNKI